MLQQRWSFVAVAIVTCILQAHGADKYTDENRPYEFGFTIDGEQHRHEKKDENGLIMGEFGFITADGVYHVTVYATDENGNFKILSMKNIRVKPYPTAPERQGHSLPFPVSLNPAKPESFLPPKPGSTLPQKPPIAVSSPPIASPVRSCSSCRIPTTTTTTRKPELTLDLGAVSKDQANSQFGANRDINSNYPQGKQPNYPDGQQVYPSPKDVPTFGGQNPPSGSRKPNQKPGAGTQPNYPQGPRDAPSVSGQNPPSGLSIANQKPITGPQPNYPQVGDQPNYDGPGIGGQSTYPQQGQNYPQPGSSGPVSPSGQTAQGVGTGSNSGDRNPKQFTDYPQPPVGPGPQNIPQSFGEQYPPQSNERPSKPTLITAQMQIVDKDTDIYKKKPGEKDGLPDGISKDDMLRLLYTFNYTVGFHGHFEEGYTNGAKQGYYYVTGRNGVRTRVDYVADEKGFRPKISREVLDLLSDDVPKPETEKDEKYGLKGYEFKWLYYPVESSKRR